MTYAYRFVIDGTGIDFVAPGELQKAEGCYMVVAEVSFDQALALQEHAKAETPITIWVEVGGQAVAFMPVRKVKAKPGRGQFVEVAAMVRVPDPFEQARKQ
jgi:hypothetical protein